MSYAYDIKLAKLRDRHDEAEDELIKTEVKIHRTVENIRQGLDSSGELQKVVDELMQKAVEQKERVRKLAEEIALLEAQAP